MGCVSSKHADQNASKTTGQDNKQITKAPASDPAPASAPSNGESDAKRNGPADETGESRKRRAAVSAQAVSEKEMAEWKKPVHEKSDESKALLRNIISTNPKLQVLFGHLGQDQLSDVIMAMFPREANTGDRIITQGETGDAFWIVESGKFDIFVNRAGASAVKAENSATWGDKVLECESGHCFGELALMYNAPRAATVVAKSTGKLWGLDALSFKLMIVTQENIKKKKYEAFLEDVEILKELNKYERANLSDVLDSASFKAGETIMKQGDSGDRFYILESGEAKAYMSDGGQPEVLVKHYSKPGEYFGELALILASARKASVYAGDKGCNVLYLSKDKFDRILGPIKHRLRVEKYPQYADFLNAAKNDNSDDHRPKTAEESDEEEEQ